MSDDHLPDQSEQEVLWRSQNKTEKWVTENWSLAEIEVLVSLWFARGENGKALSCGEIGKRLVVGKGKPRTKNSIISKVHKLRLPGRPSPIKIGEPKPQTPKPERASPNRKIAKPKYKPVNLDTERKPRGQKIRPPDLSVRLSTHACSWPLGCPRSPDFRFCDQPAIAGKSYCPQHYARAYRPPGSRVDRDEAA
jgi:GcrA cell cycle regulator